ncbi:MAG: Ubiquinone biosynthesis O-methyltransferase [Phycisphaerae bacterium]|nr:Ubiquinone biosynthesis O-methyltransferase [Phycisphaerae bacterium]
MDDDRDMPKRMGLQEGYDRWATIYDDEKNPLVLIEESVVQRWLANVPGQMIADVGCGTGRHSWWLAQRGARIDAFDGSTGMLAIARRKCADWPVTFHQHMLPDPLPAEDDTYDVVLLALVADHLDDLMGACCELQRVAKPGGEIIITMLHPAMNLKGITARFTDPADGSEVRVAAYEHTFGDYVMAALNAGLIIEEIVERRADAELVQQTPRAEKYLGWPLLLAMKMRK